MTAPRPIYATDGLPPPPEQWPAHMDARQVAFVTGVSVYMVHAAEKAGELGQSCASGAYGRKMWSREQVKAWRGITSEPQDPFVNASVA